LKKLTRTEKTGFAKASQKEKGKNKTRKTLIDHAQTEARRRMKKLVDRWGAFSKEGTKEGGREKNTRKEGEDEKKRSI